MVAAPAFPFPALQARLWQRPDGVFRSCEWLSDSWQHRAEFRRALLLHFATQVQQPLKSRLESGYDWYHDLVLRHQGLMTPALIAPGAALEKPQATLYSDLHALCSRRCAAWSAAGVRAGDSLCIVGNVGQELLVSLLSGLRLGLVITLLPPAGPDYLARRLKALRPQHLAMPSHYQTLLVDTDWTGRCLPSAAAPGPVLPSSGGASGSHTYEGGSAAFALFSPLREAQDQPVTLTASESYFAAVRDGLLFLRLNAGTTVWAPDHVLLEQQPALLLTSLLHGGTYMHGVALDDLQPVGQLPAAQVLFASCSLRDRMLERPARALTGLQLWLVHPKDAHERPWADWAAHVGASAVPAMSWWSEPASGGCLLFSTPRLGFPPQYVQPAPGLEFAFQAVDQSQLPVKSGAGLFRHPDNNSGSLGIYLSSSDSGLIVGGTAEPLHQGARYPAAEVEEAVGKLPFVHAAIVLLQTSATREPTLLIFMGPEPLEAARELTAARIAAAREQVSHRLGPEFLPSAIELFAMFPRRSGGPAGPVDRQWAQRNYGAALREREANPLFRLLDRLRAAWAGPLAADPAAPAALAAPPTDDSAGSSRGNDPGKKGVTP